MKREDYIKAIQTFEPVFFDAGKLAVELQKGIVPKTKLGTGVHDIDVVTDADTAVQEMVLSAASKTILSECRLVAEEDTESVGKFNPNGEFLFAIDPIDGTHRYAEGGQIFSLIVSLQAPGLPIYTFAHYPAIRWTHWFIGNTHREEGQKPGISIKRTDKAITYSYGDPKSRVSDLEIQKMKTRGYDFVDKESLTSDCGATTTLLAGVVEGYYCEDPLAVDGLVGMHYGLAHNCEIHSTLQKEWPKPGFGGIRYSGYYFVIREGKN